MVLGLFLYGLLFKNGFNIFKRLKEDQKKDNNSWYQKIIWKSNQVLMSIVLLEPEPIMELNQKSVTDICNIPKYFEIKQLTSK